MPRITVSGVSHDVPEGTIADAVRSLGLRPDSYLYLIDGAPVPMDTVLSADSEVRALRVASGGRSRTGDIQ